MLLHACGGFPGASRPFWKLQGLPGASRGLQGPPEPQNPKNEKCAPPRTAKASNLGEAEISRGMVRLD